MVSRRTESRSTWRCSAVTSRSMASSTTVAAVRARARAPYHPTVKRDSEKRVRVASPVVATTATIAHASMPWASRRPRTPTRAAPSESRQSATIHGPKRSVSTV